MTPDKQTTMDDEIRAELTRIEGMIQASRGNGEMRWWKGLQILCSVAMAIVMPWGIWVTNQIYGMETEQAKFREWQSIGPRFTSTDAERLRLQVKEELRAEIATKLDVLSGKVDFLRTDMSELKYQLIQHVAKERQP